MSSIPLPKAKVGDVIVADIHPSKGYVMFEVGSAYRNENFHWVYVSTDGKLEAVDLWVEHVYKRRDLTS